MVNKKMNVRSLFIDTKYIALHTICRFILICPRDFRGNQYRILPPRIIDIRVNTKKQHDKYYQRF